MQTLETISAKSLNKLKTENPELYKDLIAGKTLKFEISAGTQSGKRTWSDYSLAELKALQRNDPELFDVLFEAERMKVLAKYKM